MVILTRAKRLRKNLGLLDVYAVALGTTLSAGFFLLPGLAVIEAGPAVVIAYLTAAIPLIPAMFSIVELATAMPRAGGSYYFLDRSLGPVVGTIGGLGTWLALVLKTAFALIGMSAYLALIVPGIPVLAVAGCVALALGVLCVWGTKEAGTLQIVLVVGLLAILTWFIGGGIVNIEPAHFDGALSVEATSILSTAGLVYISYVGITKIASLSEEVRDPERTLPLGVFLALGTAIAIYVLGTLVMVGVVPIAELKGNLTPAAAAGEAVFGVVGSVVISFAALLAFVSVANAGILSASRYPLAMSRDHVLPAWFRALSARGTPKHGVAVTVGLVLVVLLTLDPMRIAKLAGAFQLLMFGLLNLGVIVMRESHIASYDPGYRSPLYPWMQIFGILAPLVLIASMGTGPALFSMALIAVGVAWYFAYARDRVIRSGAIYHVFERLGRQRFPDLETELRSILKEKGLRDEDPFDEAVARASVLDLEWGVGFEELVARVSDRLAERIGCPSETLVRGFLEGTRVGATPVEHGVAIPHLRLPGIAAPELVLARSKTGIEIDVGSVFGDASQTARSNALFFLVSPDGDASQHLRFLAQLAARVEEDDFMPDWTAAPDRHSLREILIRSERSISLTLERGRPTEVWIDRTVRDVDVPEGCLIVMIRRRGDTVVPSGATQLCESDRLVLIGSRKEIRALRQRFQP
jgi:amino acid transporter/mannitol/fructose-specific phosphotransferase system IIA component (Ntr-type)